MQDKPEKKLLKNPVLASLLVPVAIVLVGSLLIFGVTKMLSTDRDHRDLIKELESKTFGNRWVAAYELSKLLAASKISEDEKPFVVERLSNLYARSNDPRTRNFLVTALSSLGVPAVLPTLTQALKDSDSQVQFSAMVGLGNMPKGTKFDWDPIIELTRLTKDEGLRQAGLLTLATHRVVGAEALLVSHLNASSVALRYAAALGLIHYRNNAALGVLAEIFQTGGAEKSSLDSAKLVSLKLNVLELLSHSPWEQIDEMLRKVLESEKNQKVRLKIQNYLQRAN